jgi:ankyrin repeat protein
MFMNALRGFYKKRKKRSDDELLQICEITGNVGDLIAFFHDNPTVDPRTIVFSNCSRQYCDGHSPLTIASMCGHLTVVEYLITRKRCGVDDVDAKRGATALHFSCWGGHNALVMYLCSKGADCNKSASRYKQSSPLHWAAK